MTRGIVIICVGILATVIAIAAFVFLPDPQSIGVASVSALILVGCIFLRRVTGEPAVGTRDAPEVSPTKDYTGGGSI